MALRIPAIVPLRPQAARPCTEDPSPRLEALFRRIWETAMHDLPFVNPALAVEAIGFRRVQGDWVGAVVTPWFINLFLLPGGGELWQDTAGGEHRQVEFPVGRLEFIAETTASDDHALTTAYQYCPLITPVQDIPDQAAARAAAEAVMLAVLAPPGSVAADAAVATAAVAPTDTESPPARRAFLRGLLPPRA